MIPLLQRFRPGQRVWCRSEAEYGTVASEPGAVMSGIGAAASPRYVVVLRGGNRIYAHPSDLEPCAAPRAVGFPRLATMNGEAV